MLIVFRLGLVVLVQLQWGAAAALQFIHLVLIGEWVVIPLGLRPTAPAVFLILLPGS
jgi:hypothetical protein